MKSKVAIYESHDKALSAVHFLKDKNFPIKNVSIIGEAELKSDHMHLKSNVSTGAPLAIGAVAGTVAGVLTGIGIFAIPGFGFLYGAGAVVGAIGGFDLGVLTGGVGSLLSIIGIKEDDVTKYEQHMHDGKHLLLVSGNEEDIEKAERILHTEGTHLE